MAGVLVQAMTLCLMCSGSSLAVGKLGVESGFEGASVNVLEIDQKERSISFMPGGDPLRGWPCWWYFRATGVIPGEIITLKLKGSTATVMKPGAPLSKPLASLWAMPSRATYSVDNAAWKHS
ncbi:MAG: zinc carboxypeptidase, partial [Planctomycetes bacterium]|nr:zinc carboxypeptidase [Planctomycetota bacterium]